MGIKSETESIHICQAGSSALLQVWNLQFCCCLQFGFVLGKAIDILQEEKRGAQICQFCIQQESNIFIELEQLWLKPFSLVSENIKEG